MTGPHHTPALSASRLSLYKECPALYRRRYIDKIVDPPTIDMEYGQAIHHALEAHFKGQDAELAFLQDLKQRIARLPGCEPADWLVPQGLKLINHARQLDVRGVPERSFIFVHDGFRIPFRGILDLVDIDGAAVIDWKTTRRAWSEKTPATYAFQQAIYMRAAEAEFHLPFSFSFVALGAYPGGGVQVLPSSPTEADTEDVWNEIFSLYLGIEAQLWICTCRDKRHQLEDAA